MSIKKISHVWTGRPDSNNQPTLRGSRRVLAGGLMLLGLLTSIQAFATTIVYKNFDDLVKEADGIVSGRVASIQSQYNADHEIYTFVTFDQLDVLGGSFQGPSLTLRFKGGQVDNNISQIVGSPEFSLNEQVVLFVQGNGQSMVPVVGWTQGVFRVAQDSSGQQVIHDHEGNRVLGIRASQVMTDMNAQPVAHIVGQQHRNFVSTMSENKGSEGTADNNAQALPSTTARAAALKAMPTMTSQSFVSTVKNSAAAKTFQRPMTSVGVGDFSLPANSHTDAAMGAPTPAVQVPNSQSPAEPTRKAMPQVQDQF